MKEFLQHAFDIFGYVIPGLFVIFSISILVVPLNSLDEAIALTQSFDAGIATVWVIVAYVIGFCIYPIGRILYKTVGFTLFGNNIHDDSNQSNLSVPAKYALLREHSPMNFKYVESWNIYCAMSHNLMVACLVFCFVALIKSKDGLFGLFWMGITDQNAIYWVGAFFLSLSVFLILTYRAVTYFHWAAYDINATISSLNLASISEEESM